MRIPQPHLVLCEYMSLQHEDVQSEEEHCIHMSLLLGVTLHQEILKPLELGNAEHDHQKQGYSCEGLPGQTHGLYIHGEAHQMRDGKQEAVGTRCSTIELYPGYKEGCQNVF